MFLRLILSSSDQTKKIQQTKYMIKKIELAPSFTAMEFFDVNRGTVTTVLGIIVTYCIVMFQTLTCND